MPRSLQRQEGEKGFRGLVSGFVVSSDMGDEGMK